MGTIRPTSEGGLTESVAWDKDRVNKMRELAKLAAKQQMESPKGPGKAGTGYPVQREIRMEQLKKIYRGFAHDMEADDVKKAQGVKYLASLNKAFKIMKIDTVEAQSNYLAHAFIESDQFRRFTETQQDKQAWEEDPKKINVQRGTLADVFKEGGEEYDFIGRGPVQVTFRAAYVEVVAMLERAAQQYENVAATDREGAKFYATSLRNRAARMKAGKVEDLLPEVASEVGLDESLSDREDVEKRAEFFEQRAATDVEQARADAALCREAAKEVKAHPEKAADPKYAFLVSAAFMKMQGADVRIQQDPLTWKKETPPPPGKENKVQLGIAASWVGGGELPKGSQQETELPKKRQAYLDAYAELCTNSDQCKAAAAEAAAKKPPSAK